MKGDAVPARAQDGDAALFDALYAAHYRALFAYLLGQTGDRETAADLLQETFLRAWNHLATVRALPEDRRRFWLLATARNLARDHHRRHVVRTRYAEQPSAPPSTSAGTEDPAQTVLRRATVEGLDAAIRNLPPELRTVLALQVVGEMTSAEIGALLDRPAGTVRYQLSQARQRLARALQLGEEPACPIKQTAGMPREANR